MIRAVGSRVIVSMTDLDRLEAAEVEAPGFGRVRVGASQVDQRTGLALGVDRYPHQGTVLAVGAEADDRRIRPGMLAFLVADLGATRFDWYGMNVQSVQTAPKCGGRCGMRRPTNAIFAAMTAGGDLMAPGARVIVERIPDSEPAGRIHTVEHAKPGRLAWSRVVAVGVAADRGLRPGVDVLHSLDAGVHWTDATGRDLVSLVAPSRRACGCGRLYDRDALAVRGANAKQQEDTAPCV